MVVIFARAHTGKATGAPRPQSDIQKAIYVASRQVSGPAEMLFLSCDGSAKGCHPSSLSAA
jgi:hypothetical protein